MIVSPFTRQALKVGLVVLQLLMVPLANTGNTWRAISSELCGDRFLQLTFRIVRC